MFFKEWKPIYEQILSDFSFSESADKKSAEVLDDLLKKHPYYIPLPSLSPMIHHKTVVIIGADSQVLEKIKTYHKMIGNQVCISADGATSALLKYNLLPDIIVTDLDGDINDQIRANRKGSILVVHAHGDNQEIIEEVVPLIPKSVSGTMQADPSLFSCVSNVGGFTDGDRAVFLADHFNAQTMYLIGFDFHGPIGTFSNLENKDLKLKRRKLLWAEKLISLIDVKQNIEFLE